MNRRKDIRHGTLSGYHLELLRGMDTCDKCRAANAEYHRNYRKVRKEQFAQWLAERQQAQEAV